MLFTTALNSGDLRVRAAAIEVNIAGRNLEKESATVDRLEPAARTGEQGPRANALWDIGLLGNRGVEPDRAADILLASIHDPNENVRYWAVEGLAYLGTDAVIDPLLDVLHDDPSPLIRERAACGLAQSGMLSERQRRTRRPAVARLCRGPRRLTTKRASGCIRRCVTSPGRACRTSPACLEGLVRARRRSRLESRDARSLKARRACPREAGQGSPTGVPSRRLRRPT